MSKLVEGLNELERQARGLRGVTAWELPAALPRVTKLFVLLFALLSDLVHQSERQRVMLENIAKGMNHGKD